MMPSTLRYSLCSEKRLRLVFICMWPQVHGQHVGWTSNVGRAKRCAAIDPTMAAEYRRKKADPRIPESAFREQHRSGHARASSTPFRTAAAGLEAVAAGHQRFLAVAATLFEAVLAAFTAVVARVLKLASATSDACLTAFCTDS